MKRKSHIQMLASLMAMTAIGSFFGAWQPPERRFETDTPEYNAERLRKAQEKRDRKAKAKMKKEKHENI